MLSLITVSLCAIEFKCLNQIGYNDSFLKKLFQNKKLVLERFFNEYL